MSRSRKRRLKRKQGDNTDYGAAALFSTGHDPHGNPLYRRDTPTNDRIVLKNFDQTQGNARHAINQTSSMVDKLLYTRLISKTDYDVAIRFTEDFEETGLRAKSGSSYEPREKGGEAEMSDAASQAHNRWTEAVQAMGPRYGDIICSVVLYDFMPSSRDIETLKEGLMRLAIHYGHIVG